MTPTPGRVPSDARYAPAIKIAETVLGHTFADPSLIATALTHPSALDEVVGSRSYERLEFLGDAVVEMIVSDEVFARFPEMDEGGMTRMKISLVSGVTLSEVASDLGLRDAIVFGQSYERSGGRGVRSALENVFEAIVAALYLDAGYTVARDFVLHVLGPRISEDMALEAENPKSTLQELLQAHGVAPTYRVVAEEGPAHARTFTCEVLVDDAVAGSGTGRSKKEAEAEAAREALSRLSEGSGGTYGL